MSSSGHRGKPLKLRSKSAFLALLIAPLFSACSWALVEGPPVGYERFNYVPCTVQKVLPTTDAAVSVVTTWLGLAILLEDDFSRAFNNNFTFNRTSAAATFLTTGVLAGVSAGIGYSRATKCRAAQLEVAARNREVTAQNQDESSRSPEYAWFGPLIPAPIFGADPPDLFDQLLPAPDLGANAFDPIFGSAISNSPEQ
jgi:hypothetical protein